MPSFAELYPTELRANGASFCASVGRGVASVVPGMVGILSVNMTLPVAMGACAIASYIVGIIAALLLRDKTGIDLRTLDRESAVSAVQAVGKGRTDTNSSAAANGGMT